MAGASTLPFQQSIELVERKSAKHSLAVSVWAAQSTDTI
jgi:hypothetical protein